MPENAGTRPFQVIQGSSDGGRRAKPYGIAAYLSDLDLLAQSSAEVPYIVVGTARLPASITGTQSQALMVELTLDGPAACITDVATSLSLPGYTGLLRGLLIGQRLRAIEAVTWRLCRHLRSPLLRPTVAALRNAAGHHDIDTAA